MSADFRARCYGLNMIPMIFLKDTLETCLNENTSCCRMRCTQATGDLNCVCGETDNLHTWNWEQPSSSPGNAVVIENGNAVVIEDGKTIIEDGKTVIFNPIYSAGTSSARGNMVFSRNRHYYWEMKITTYLYGTDFMIGVGTSKVDSAKYRSRFCSMLGSDDQSWGYSYHGTLHHNKMTRKYGSVFGMGCLIGVHLNMYDGTLEYYLNRAPLGIAFTGLKNHDLYPIVCSTAAQSSLRLTCSVDFEHSLQFECIKALNKNPSNCKIYDDIPGLRRAIPKELFWLVNEVYFTPKKEDNKIELEDEAIIQLDTSSCRYTQHNTVRLNKWGRYIETPDSTDAHKKRIKRCCGIGMTKAKREREQFSKSCQRIDVLRKEMGAMRCQQCEKMGNACTCDQSTSEIYDDLPPVNITASTRMCGKCNFKLGIHDFCLMDSLCSLCEGSV